MSNKSGVYIFGSLTCLLVCVPSYVLLSIVSLILMDLPAATVLGFLICALLVPLIIWRPKPYKTGILVGVALSAVLLWLTPSSRDVFLRDLFSVAPGMATAQVERIMKPYRVVSHGKGAGSDRSDTIWLRRQAGRIEKENRIHPGFLNPTKDETFITYGHSDTPEYGGDWGTVYFRHGRVVRVDFSPD